MNNSQRKNFTDEVLSWKGVNQISKKFLNRVEKTLAIRDRLSLEYVVTGDNIDLPQLGNPIHGACK